MPYKLILIHQIILVTDSICDLWSTGRSFLVTICFTGYRITRHPPAFLLRGRKKKTVNPFYSFVTFTFCDPNGPLQRRFMIFYFSLMSNKIPCVICCHDLNVHVRNFLVKFTEQLHHFCHGLGATVNSCLFDVFRISEHLPIFCPISFCSVPIPSLTRQMFVHAVLQHPLTSRRWTLFLCTFSPTNFIPHLRLLPPL